MNIPIQPEAPVAAPASKNTAGIVVGLTHATTSAPDVMFFPQYLHMHAAALGIRLVDHPASSAEQQVRTVARLREEKVRLLMVVAHTPDDRALAEALAGCKESGISVLRLLSPEATDAEVGSIYCAVFQTACALARQVCERLGGRGKILFLHDHDPTTDGPQRRGIQKALEEFSQIELVSTALAAATDSGALASALEAHQDAAAVLASSDELALQIVAALKPLGLSPFVAGFGGSPDGLDAIERGVLGATGRVDYDRLAQNTLIAALRTAEKRSCDVAAPGAFDIVTRENLEHVALQAARSEFALARDVARRNEEARQRIEFFEAVIDTLPLNLFVKDAKELRYLLINRAREEWFNIRRADQLGKSARDLYPKELADRFETSDRRILNSEPDPDLPADEDHYTMGPKGPRYVQTRKAPIYAEDGSPAYLVGASFDTTERKLAQIALAQRNIDLEAAHQAMKEQQTKLIISEKMASLGRLTAGIAHEMNTPLAAVRAAMSELTALTDEYLEAIGDASVTPDDHRQIAGDIKKSISLAEKSAARAAAFVRGIKTQTRGGDAARRSKFNAVQIIEEAILLLSHALIAANISAKFSCDSFEGNASVVEIYGAPARLSQVVTNLLTNAIDAMTSKGTGGGVIRVELIAAGERCSLRVIDQGTGIPADVLPNIFEPLFTTKQFGGGMGLGLAIVHDIVTAEFGGTIEVRSTVGEGTTIEIFLSPELAKESSKEYSKGTI